MQSLRPRQMHCRNRYEIPVHRGITTASPKPTHATRATRTITITTITTITITTRSETTTVHATATAVTRANVRTDSNLHTDQDQTGTRHVVLFPHTGQLNIHHESNARMHNKVHFSCRTTRIRRRMQIFVNRQCALFVLVESSSLCMHTKTPTVRFAIAATATPTTMVLVGRHT